VIVPFIVEVVPDVANIPTLSFPRLIVPPLIFVVTPSRTIPVFLDPVEFILFDVSPFVVPLRYTPIPSVPVIVILSFCTDVRTPLWLE